MGVVCKFECVPVTRGREAGPVTFAYIILMVTSTPTTRSGRLRHTKHVRRNEALAPRTFVCD